MKKIRQLDKKVIYRIYCDKVGDIIDRGFPREVAKRIALEFLPEMRDEENESESDSESYKYL